jgi:hypothetical protein
MPRRLQQSLLQARRHRQPRSAGAQLTGRSASSVRISARATRKRAQRVTTPSGMYIPAESPRNPIWPERRRSGMRRMPSLPW